MPIRRQRLSFLNSLGTCQGAIQFWRDTPASYGQSRDDRSGLSEDCAKAGWRRGVSNGEIAAFREGGTRLLFASFAIGWLLKPDAYAGAAGGIRGGGA
jgi:hypothetical protein